MDRSHLFLPAFPPWKVEELACVRDYLDERWADLFKEIESDVSRDSPRFAKDFRKRPDTPPGLLGCNITR